LAESLLDVMCVSAMHFDNLDHTTLVIPRL